jgi:catechol 2,3-dioxygenase-like lactoylglutathione lyase family enzyme
MSHQEEFYPMPFFATLTVDDLEASTRWYTDVLGFRLVFSLPGPNGAPLLSHLRWTRYADLLLAPGGVPTLSKTDKGVGVRLSFLVTEGTVDELADQVKARGYKIAEGPVTQPWNTREFTVHDPDGYTLTFFQQADQSLTFDQVVGNVARDALDQNH